MKSRSKDRDFLFAGIVAKNASLYPSPSPLAITPLSLALIPLPPHSSYTPSCIRRDYPASLTQPPRDAAPPFQSPASMQENGIGGNKHAAKCNQDHSGLIPFRTALSHIVLGLLERKRSAGMPLYKQQENPGPGWGRYFCG